MSEKPDLKPEIQEKVRVEQQLKFFLTTITPYAREFNDDPEFIELIGNLAILIKSLNVSDTAERIDLEVWNNRVQNFLDKVKNTPNDFREPSQILQ